MTKDTKNEYYLKNLFGSLFSDVRSYVKTELPVKDRRELLTFAPASLLRDRKYGATFDRDAGLHSIPMLVVSFSDETVDQLPGPSFGRRNNRSNRTTRKNRGLPELAILFKDSPETDYLAKIARYFHLPFVTVENSASSSWIIKEIELAYLIEQPKPSVQAIVSDPQSQISESLEEAETLFEELEQYGGEGSPRLAIQQEVKLSSVIGTNSNTVSTMLEGGSFDFVVFGKDFPFSREEDGASMEWRPLLAIEYDGRFNHQDYNQRKRDEKKDELCLKAQLPLLRLDKEFLPPDDRYPDRSPSATRARRLRNEAILNIVMHALSSVFLDRLRRRGFENRFKELLNSGVAEDRLDAFLQTRHEFESELEWDRAIERQQQLQQLREETGADLDVQLREKSEGRYFGVITDRQTGQSRPSPSLKLRLVSSSLGLSPLEVAESVIMNWIVENERKRFGIKT